MLKKTLLLIILLLTCSCSHSLNSLFGQGPTNKYGNYHPSDRHYLEDDAPPRRTEVLREEMYPVADPRSVAREEYYEEEDEEEDEEYDDRPPVRDRCSFYGLTPGTAAHHDCHRQLNQQSRQGYSYAR